MEISGIGSWKWPTKEDILWYPKEDVIQLIEKPKPLNNRGMFAVDDMKKFHNFE